MAETGLPRDEILARLRAGALAARDDVVGVIVFGSFARGTPYRDVDVLVVLERLAPGREAWARALHALRKAVLACWGIFERTHYAAGVLLKHLDRQGITEWRERLTGLASIARRREADAVRSRYIDDVGKELWISAERYDRSQAVAALNDGRDALATARAFVDWWLMSGQEGKATVTTGDPEP